MTKLQLNCDMGEGSFADPRDLALLPYVDAVNIALGGHAGDADTARDLAQRAAAAGVQVHLHPSYPDRRNFGRCRVDMPAEDLLRSLDLQRAILPEVTHCKFHGALYQESTLNADLAELLVDWLLAQNIATVLTLGDGALAKCARAAGLRVLAEGFADRGYCLNDGSLALVPRGDPRALLASVAAVEQRVIDLVGGTVVCIDGQRQPLQIDTICIHGDGEQALAFAAAARAVLAGSC